MLDNNIRNITLIIESFSDWEKPWTFYNFVINNSNISEIEKNNFSKAYQEASKFELWNFTDLNIGIENSKAFLKHNTGYTENAIKQIINAIAYELR